MELLRNRLLKDAICLPGNVLKVDSFINHQIDPMLIKAVAEEFISRFSNLSFNKILTIESSGIAPALMIGYLLNLPVLFAKKRKPSTMENILFADIYSYTKNSTYRVCISNDFLTEKDKVLFIDDFLANGNAALGILEIIKKAGAELVGMGFIIEKGFQDGGKILRNKGYKVESLVTIQSLDNSTINLQ